MTTLYELSAQYLALAEMADDPNLPPEVLANSLEGLGGLLETKAQALLQVTTGWEGDIGAIDNEIKRLQARKSVIQNRVDNLRAYLQFNMEQTGISKISCALFQITLPKGSPMVVVTNESLIPESFTNTTTIRKPVKSLILAALKDGEDVPGCLLGTSKASLRIK